VEPSDGDVLVVSGPVVDEFEPTPLENEYAFVGQFGLPRSEENHPESVAVDDGNGDIYVTENYPERSVDEFDSTGVYLGRLTGTGPTEPFGGLDSVTVDPESHEVYVGVNGGVDVFGENIVSPDVTTKAVSDLTAASAVLNGAVDPDGAGEASCQFEYGTSVSYGQFAPCSPGKVANGSVAAAVESKPVKGLQPDTTYFYRLDATNANGHQNTGECPEDCGEFKTPGVGVKSESAGEVTATSASLQATLAPNGAATSYYFQVATAPTEGCTPSTCTDVPDATGVPVGSGPGEVPVEQSEQQGLSPGAVYHYRVVAVSEVPVEVAPGKLETERQSFDGPDRTFTTQATGAFALPDGRQWEMVSPPQKDGALIEGINSGNLDSVIKAAANGDAMTYFASGPTEPDPEGSGGASQVLSRRVGASTWVSQDLNIVHSQPSGVSAGQGEEYRAFSEDLSLAVVQPFGPFVPCSNAEGVKQQCLSEAASEQTAFLRTNFYNGNVDEPCTGSCYRPLVTGCPGEGKPCPPAVKEIADVPEGTHFGGENTTCGGGAVCGPLFGDATPDMGTIEVGGEDWCAGKLGPPGSCPEPVLGPRVRVDEIESAEGSWVYSLSGTALRVSHGGITKPVAVLSAEDAEHLTGNFQGNPVFTVSSARVSPDGRWLAFMSQEPLTGYDNRDAISSQRDEEVFLYHAPENLATQSGSLICASCNPTGARPHGAEAGEGKLPLTAPSEYNGQGWAGVWLAANVPGWSWACGVTGCMYQPRYLSDSGRLFFNASDALVPRDVNGQEDVYEYEPEGAGPEGAACGPTSASGSEVFKPAREFEVEGTNREESAGCVALISSGTSREEAAFLDASETGGDVFFLTTSELAPQDFDQAYDVYDAHECSNTAPCSIAAAAPPPCLTAEACRAAPIPQPAIYGAPASATFSGAGNVAPSTGSGTVKPKGLGRAQKLADALRACRKDRARRKRVSCEASARRKYGAGKKSSKESTVSKQKGR
jgi:hypothetical protein